MNSNTATALIVVAICATIASCYWTDTKAHDNALTKCLHSCVTHACMKLCGEIAGCGKTP